MSRVKERKERLRKKRRIYFLLSIYIIFIMLCLFRVDYTFNTLTTGEAKQTLFKINIERSFIDITLLGGNKQFSLKGVLDIFKSLYN
ncbi:hypothetical protein J2Z80_002261 [Thermoanaerobacterium butyriciformans]|uniref:Uncharacterized protein n=1 Tax=Thermoanaerobacterium butyriciformans TaxID=1702242 RepID=A0ABS4NGD3_9THEO|nr:hypothetical protein [Thermoanaerobacterium butyriciformans]